MDMHVQDAKAQISTLVSTCATAIQKEEKAAESALTNMASQHESKVRQHEQRMQEAHAAYQAAMAAEWAELQKTVASQAAALQVTPPVYLRKLMPKPLPEHLQCPCSRALWPCTAKLLQIATHMLAGEDSGLQHSLAAQRHMVGKQ